MPERSEPQLKMKTRVVRLLLLMVLVVSLLIAVPGLRSVITTIRHIHPVWIGAGIGLELASCLSFVVLFRSFFDRLSPCDARALAWTEMASGALLPGGGAGGLAIGGWLIHLTGAPTRWIIRRSGGLFFLTSAVNAATVIIAGTLLALGVSHPNSFALTLVPILIVLPLTLIIAALPHGVETRQPVAPWLQSVSAGVQDAEDATLRHPSWRLLGALGYLGFDMAVLWILLKGFGEPISFPALMLAYNLGWLANMLPVPGGIGVLDAGLAGSLLLYGAPAGHVAAAVLVYHAIALWTPGLGGTIAYLSVRSRLTPGHFATPEPPEIEPGPDAASTEVNPDDSPSSHPDPKSIRMGRQLHRRRTPRQLPGSNRARASDPLPRTRDPDALTKSALSPRRRARRAAQQ
jgi:uncharacterized membrane protein YbhN (UPF0104 family)